MMVPDRSAQTGLSALVDRIAVPRRRSYRDPVRFGSGVDFGSDGIEIVEVRTRDGQISSMLAWFGGHRVPAAGVRGFGHVYVPAQLVIVREGGFESTNLQTGGRLSRSSLRIHAELIDREFGAGTACQIDIRRTLVISEG